jgi:methylmalonyl-CoA/ethylmalonyl-CoA epimerase
VAEVFKELIMRQFFKTIALKIAVCGACMLSLSSSYASTPSKVSAAPNVTHLASSALDIKPYAITLSVPNIEEAAQWYVRVLGFKLDQSKNYPEFKTRLAFLVREGFRVELIEDANAKPGPVRADAPAHTSIHCYSQFMFQTRDIDVIKRHMRSQQVPIHFEFENAELGIKIFFIRDPNQNLITFVQRM